MFKMKKLALAGALAMIAAAATATSPTTSPTAMPRARSTAPPATRATNSRSFAACGLDRRRPEASRSLLALATIEEVRLARRLPPHFAPLPRSPRLQAIAMEFASLEKAEWTMEDWAAFAGMSVRTLSCQVQAETGLTFRNWRLQHVLLVSLGQLARETSVEEAALTAGYQNTSAFISAFRQVFGMTPGEYRRTLQGA